MKKAIIIIALLICSIGVMAYLVEERIDPSVEVTVMTPVLSCSSNATILNNNGTSTSVAMTSISNGIYNLTFNQSTGSYTIILCDNTTAHVSVRTTIDTKIEEINDTIYANSSSIRSDVSDVNTTANSILDDTSEIQGNQSNFVTAVGFSTLSNATSIRNDISNVNTTSNSILDDTSEIQGNQSNFVTATGFCTLTNATSIRNDISNINTTVVDTNTGVSSMYDEGVYCLN